MEYHFSDLFSWTSGKPIMPTEGNVPIYGSNGIIGYSNKATYCNKIILGRVGAYCGSVAYCSTDFNATDNTLITTCDTTKILYGYAYYLLRQFNLNGYAGGAAQPLITQGLLKRLKCDVPTIKQQQYIIDLLSAYDNLIEVNNKRIKMLEQMAENLYKEWFVRFRFPAHENAGFKNGLPKGWLRKRADEVMYFNPTLPIGNQSSFTIIPMEALSTTSMVLDSKSFIIQDYISGRRSQNGDTLFAKITPCLENGKTGFVMGLPDGEVLGGSTEFIVLRSKALTPHYVYCLARSYYFRQTAILSMNGADGRQRVDENKLKSTKVIQPEKEALEQFEKLVSPFFDQIHCLDGENDNLIKQRDLLLPSLMSGKLGGRIIWEK